VKRALEDPETKAKLLRFARVNLKNEADAEEAVQETFARAWKKKDLYDPDAATVGVWLAGFARNVFNEKYRDRKETQGRSGRRIPRNEDRPRTDLARFASKSRSTEQTQPAITKRP